MRFVGGFVVALSVASAALAQFDVWKGTDGVVTHLGCVKRAKSTMGFPSVS